MYVPLEYAYEAGWALAITSFGGKDAVKSEIRRNVLRKFENAVPAELIQSGREDFKGDMTRPVPLALTSGDVREIGEAILEMPTGREIVEAFDLTPEDRAELEAFRTIKFRAYLRIYNYFERAGGKPPPLIKLRIEEKLS